MDEKNVNKTLQTAAKNTLIKQRDTYALSTDYETNVVSEIRIYC